MTQEYKSDYKNYLLDISSKIGGVEIYSHVNTSQLLNNPGAFGYDESIEDMDLVLEKVRVILKVWGKNEVDTYEEFVSKKRGIRLDEMGI